MADFTFAQLEGLWEQAGGPKLVAPIAAAIALAESSGNPQAINPTDNGGTQTSWGLWQISNGTHNMPVPNILDPHVNAQQAVAKYTSAGNTFRDWGTYATGAYTKFLPSGYVAPTNVTGGSSGDLFGGIDSVISAIGAPFSSTVSIAESLTKIANSFGSLGTIAADSLRAFEWLFVPSNWIRIVSFGGGVIVLAAGTWALMKTGSGNAGDITLSLGIFLVIIASVLLFIAFHNLPTDITNFGQLLGWISRSIRQRQAATS